MKGIITRLIIILILAGLLGGGVYYMFFMDKDLRDLGYTAAEIEKLRAYKITDKVTTYNPGLTSMPTPMSPRTSMTWPRRTRSRKLKVSRRY